MRIHVDAAVARVAEERGKVDDDDLDLLGPVEPLLGATDGVANDIEIEPASRTGWIGGEGGEELGRIAGIAGLLR